MVERRRKVSSVSGRWASHSPIGVARSLLLTHALHIAMGNQCHCLRPGARYHCGFRPHDRVPKVCSNAETVRQERGWEVCQSAPQCREYTIHLTPTGETDESHTRLHLKKFSRCLVVFATARKMTTHLSNRHDRQWPRAALTSTRPSWLKPNAFASSRCPLNHSFDY